MIISDDKIKEIIAHSVAASPSEACGILAGKKDRVLRVYQMKNVSEKPELCYFMDPPEQLKVFKDMRRKKLELVGIYHSHPQSEPYPSARDVEMAYYPGAVYAIVSLRDAKTPEVRAFRIVDGRITEEEIAVSKGKR